MIQHSMMLFVSNVFSNRKIVLPFGVLGLVTVVNFRIGILPISSLTFLLTSVCIWFISLCTTFFCLHKLLQKNDPLNYFLFPKQPSSKQDIQLKPDPRNVDMLTFDIDKYFVNKWYSNISKDENFIKESRHLLGELINRLAQVQLSVSSKLLLHGILNIYLKHIKEYRRSLKRKEKYDGKLEELYRYSHLCSNGSVKAKDYFLHQLTTNLLRHFINSELWNSLPCRILVSVLSRKFTSYLLTLSSNPEILNYQFLNLVASKRIREKHNLSAYTRIYISQYYDVHDGVGKAPVFAKGVSENKSKVENDTKNHTEKLPECDILLHLKEQTSEKSEPTLPRKDDLKTENNKEKKMNLEVVCEQKEQIPSFQHVPSNSVKIYEPKVTKTNKTWRDSKDLGLGISLGQDPLDAMPVAVESVKHTGKSTFWDTDKIEHFVEDSALLSEVRHTTHTTMEGLKSSIKPISDATVNTLHNIKDLQESTVNNALHKIGDFQDEAAGMVEGILDFGRAGIRKGLRLTGLQDNIENAKSTTQVTAQTKAQQRKKTAVLTRSESVEKTLPGEDSLDSVWMNPLQMDSPNFDGQILLEKSNKYDKDDRELQIPFISMEEPPSGTNSPDPEYEDTADLASSIAKLRSLLQQRSSESSLSTPALSPMPPDELGQKVIEAEGVSYLEEGDGVMPSFYKFCAKTATGVLDKTLSTIKTALPGTVQGVESSDNAWIFVQTDQSEVDILTRMKKLLTERKEYCTLDTEIDTAYEAIDNLDVFQQPLCSPKVEFEDELDDFEVKLPITKALIDILCELLVDTDTSFVQEPVVKAILLSLGNTLEKNMITLADNAMENFCINLMTIPEGSIQSTLVLDMEVYVQDILNSLPDMARLFFGTATLTKALNLFVSSMQIQKINQDVVFQIFELISMKLIEESNQFSPPASA